MGGELGSPGVGSRCERRLAPPRRSEACRRRAVGARPERPPSRRARLARARCRTRGFEWLDAGDAEGGTLSFLRIGADAGDVAAIALNLTPTPHERFRIGVPAGGPWREALNSDAQVYGGSGWATLGRVEAEPVNGTGATTARRSCCRSRSSCSCREPRDDPRLAGNAHPQGATWDGEGVNFSLFSEHATGVDLCLYDRPDDAVEVERIPIEPDRPPVARLPARRAPGPAVRLPRPRALRATRAPVQPEQAPARPVRPGVSGPVRWHDAVYGYEIGHEDEDLSFDERDSAGSMPKCVVIDPAFTWGEDRRPETPWNRTVIYETHVKGLTMRHPSIPPEIRARTWRSRTIRSSSTCDRSVSPRWR